MRIAVLGTGYVGLVTGTCLAESGHEVACHDIDTEKIRRLRGGEVPIYEPGLAELVARNLADGRLAFTTHLAEAAASAQLIFLAVGTPSAPDGSADLAAVWSAADMLADVWPPDAVLAIKSTVPVGTNARIAARLRERTGRCCRVASNPEFLKEGAAIDDFMRPDRVVVGVREPETAALLREVYAPYLRTEKPFLVMSPESAELTKYVANALLATKISFINEVANLCERMQADVNDVRRGIGHDSRIGFAFLFPGAGYGGSCFPKDVRALAAMARQHGVPPRMLAAVDQVNEAQKEWLFTKLAAHFQDRLPACRIGIWGLAFKPCTDDVREAPSLTLVERLLAAGCKLRVYDPAALDNVRRLYGERLEYAPHPYDALDDADALAIVTEWKQFQRPDLQQMRRRMKQPVVFDGRNLYEPNMMANAGFTYYSVGRPCVPPQTASL
jgi:UDPglucose 6-dehydrogenase